MKFIVCFSLIIQLFQLILSSLKRGLRESTSCNKDPGLMSIDEKKLILLTLNRLRNQVATQSTNLGPKLPFAKNMLQMYYSDALGASAQRIANRCLYKHSDPQERKQPQFHIGENIFRMKFINGIPEKNWQNAIEDWFTEIKDFGGKSVVQFNPRGPVTEHFSQLIWANTFLVGCGFASFSDSPMEITHLYVCHFGPTGNIVNFPIYNAHYYPGCDCPQNLGCNNMNFPGLCCPSGHCNSHSIEYNGEPFKGVVPDISIKKSLLRTHSCNKDSGLMSFDEKKMIVLTHNRLRNQIATQSNSIGPKIPYATNMIQMFYSDAIGEKAQEWANKCTFKHSNPDSRKQPQFKTGENIFTKKFINGTPQKNWQSAIEAWFSEIKDFGGKSVVTFKPEGASTGHFTQLIWAYSYFVGCGFASYSDSPKEITHLYVCQYGPVGNIKGFPIYQASLVPKCDCPDGMGCNNLTFPGLCCPGGHCNHNSVEYGGEPFNGTVPDLGETQTTQNIN